MNIPLITNSYEGILGLLLVGSGFLITMLALSAFLGPKFRSRTKQLPFECGAVSVGDITEQRFNVRFYLVAMVFILFDIEIIFMYPWAIVLPELGVFALVEMLVFMAILTVGLIYVWKKGVFNWND
jgi:NADH-quinone oxidoreductase subunit A